MSKKKTLQKKNQTSKVKPKDIRTKANVPKAKTTGKKSNAVPKSTRPKKSVSKPKVAFYWLASCGGCEEAIVDLDEKLLDVVAAVDIVFWPCAMDFKVSDVEALPDKGIFASFINGAVRTSEQERMVKLLRQKSQNVIAFGACAVMGGIPALATLKNRDSIIQRAYLDPDVAENPERTTPQQHSHVPGTTLELPEFYETVYKLNDIIDVEYYLPGCPPTTSIILPALEALLAGKAIPLGAVLAPNHALCKSCDLNSTKPDRPTIKSLKRVYEIQADATKCFLAQGIICMGPATRDGCGALCIHGHMPCTGCFGPCQDMDQGAKMVGALGGIYDADTTDGIQTMTRSVVDPAGTFYRYGLSASLLGAKRKEKRNG